MATNYRQLFATCEICGNNFKIKGKNVIGKTCSKNCSFILRSIEHFNETSDKYKKECPICHKIFEDRSGHFNEKIFCSKKCVDLFKSPIWEYNGESHRVIEWAKIININAHCLLHRKNEMGWTIEETLTIPIGGKRNGKKLQTNLCD